MMPDQHRYHGDEHLAAHVCAACGDPRQVELCEECERFHCAECLKGGMCLECAAEVAE